MTESRGKQFETAVRKSFQAVRGVSIDRIPDQMGGYKGSQNICDFIVYKKPYEYYIECKSVHGGTLPFSNITETQWNGLLAKSKINGVYAGVLCWWVDFDTTAFINIEYLQRLKEAGKKSLKCPIGFVYTPRSIVRIFGNKKRVFFEYDMKEFFDAL